MMVSVAAMTAYVAGAFIVLPTVDPQVDVGVRSPFSVMALGLDPLLSAFVLVEFAALVVPAWQPLRVGGPSARARLRRPAVILGMILTAGQALFLALWAEQCGAAINPGLGFRLLTMVTLLGAAAVLIVLAQLVDRHGLGNGFSILILAWLGLGAVRHLTGLSTAAGSGEVSADALLKGALIVAGMVAATLWMFSPYRLPSESPSENTFPIRLPACGIVPLTIAPALILFLTKLASPDRGLPFGSIGRVLGPEGSGHLPALLLLSVAAAALFSWLFNRPSYVANTWRRFSETAAPASVQLKPAMLESAMFIVLIVLGQHWLLQLWGATSVPSALNIVVATAILLDLIREARAHRVHHNWVAVWEIHRVYAVDPALRLLASAGIRVFLRGLRHRTLLQFFGPFVPVHVMVQAEDAQRAQTLLESRLSSETP